MRIMLRSGLLPNVAPRGAIVYLSIAIRRGGQAEEVYQYLLNIRMSQRGTTLCPRLGSRGAGGQGKLGESEFDKVTQVHTKLYGYLVYIYANST